MNHIGRPAALGGEGGWRGDGRRRSGRQVTTATVATLGRGGYKVVKGEAGGGRSKGIDGSNTQDYSRTYPCDRGTVFLSHFSGQSPPPPRITTPGIPFPPYSMDTNIVSEWHPGDQRGDVCDRA